VKPQSPIENAISFTKLYSWQQHAASACKTEISITESIIGYNRCDPQVSRCKLPCKRRCDAVSALYRLEDDWRVIVENSELLSEKQQQQQTALWELAATEVAYIKTLKVVTDVSRFVDAFFLGSREFSRSIDPKLI